VDDVSELLRCDEASKEQLPFELAAALEQGRKAISAYSDYTKDATNKILAINKDLARIHKDAVAEAARTNAKLKDMLGVFVKADSSFGPVSGWQDSDLFVKSAFADARVDLDNVGSSDMSDHLAVLKDLAKEYLRKQ
jgi:hypothetical protein